MVAPSIDVERTIVVSIHEEKNTEVEIPRIDPEDKPKLWISKVEIHHNAMMEKIRVLVQQKLFEEVANNDNFFEGIEDITLGIEDDDSVQEEGEGKSESEEDIILKKKARILNKMLNEIMELPKDEIFSFLTSSSLPAGLKSPSKTSKEKDSKEQMHRGEEAVIDTVDESAIDVSHIDRSVTANESQITASKPIIDVDDTNETQQEDEDDKYGYNWIIDCLDPWEDLPPVVRLNAMELGYTQTLWDEDSQDLPAYRTLWNELTPSQQTAATFLANYDEETWNDDVSIALKQPSFASVIYEDDSKEEPAVDEPTDKQNNDELPNESKNDSGDTSNTKTAEMLEDEDDEDEDNDDIFNEFLSNFASEPNADGNDGNDVDMDVVAEQQSSDRMDNDKNPRDEEEEAMMYEFSSNFAESAELQETRRDIESTSEPKMSTTEKSDDDEDAMMDEFLSNFGISVDEDRMDGGKENHQQNETTNSSATRKKEDDEDTMMEEFRTNFAEPTKEGLQEEDETDDYNKKRQENESLVPPVASVEPNEEENEDAMMDEFLSNFVEPSKEEEEDTAETSTDNEESFASRSTLVPKDDNDDSEAAMEEFLSNFVEPTTEDDLNSENDRYIESVRDGALAEQDEEQPLIIHKPTVSIMERGFEGEQSPLLPSTSTATMSTIEDKATEETEKNKPDEGSSSSWFSSLFFWVPVAVAVPVVYMVVNASHQPSKI